MVTSIESLLRRLPVVVCVFGFRRIVVYRLRLIGIFNKLFIVNFRLSVSIKEFGKKSIFGEGQPYGGLFFLRQLNFQ